MVRGLERKSAHLLLMGVLEVKLEVFGEASIQKLAENRHSVKIESLFDIGGRTNTWHMLCLTVLQHTDTHAVFHVL